MFIYIATIIIPYEIKQRIYLYRTPCGGSYYRCTCICLLLSLIFARANARDERRESDIKTPEHAYEFATREVNKTSTPYNSSLNPNEGRLSYAYYSTNTRGCGG